jgi:HAD superfamily hydrolase (TIGR01509 family)
MPIVMAAGRSFDVDVVVFDKDGTLIDLDAAWGPIATGWIDTVAPDDAALAGRLDAHLGLDRGSCRLVPDGLFAAGTLENVRDATVELLVLDGWESDTVESVVERAWHGAHASMEHEQAVTLADLPALFGALVGAGLVVAVLTSDDRRPTLEFLAAAGLDHLVGAVVTADDVERPKPDPDGLLQIAARFAVPTSRLLFVGDSLADARAALAAGAPFIAVGTSSAAAGLAAASIADVGELSVG